MPWFRSHVTVTTVSIARWVMARRKSDWLRVSRGLDGADLSYFVSGAVAAVIYGGWRRAFAAGGAASSS